MRRVAQSLIIAGVIMAAMIGGFHRPDWSADTPPVFGDAPPTRADIASAIGVGPLDPTSPRAVRFGDMLTRRYRDQLYAVRVIVRPAGHIELRCGANMSRHQMALVASQVQEDARSLFGRYMDLELFETYAAGPQRRIGEMRVGRRQPPLLRFTAPPQREPDL